MATRVLITGRPGIGKTTALVRVATGLRTAGVPVAGFYTEEVRDGGTRIGFDLVTLTGERRPMARVGLPGTHRVGRYGVDVAAVDSVAADTRANVEALPLGGAVLIDEVGRMELFSRPFRGLIDAVVEGAHPFVLTVTRARVPAARALLARPDVRVVELRQETRDAAAQQVLGWFAEGADRGLRGR